MARVSLRIGLVRDVAAEIPLVALVDRLLERGVVLTGAATISVSGVDLVEVRLNVLLAGVDALERDNEVA